MCRNDTDKFDVSTAIGIVLLSLGLAAVFPVGARAQGPVDYYYADGQQVKIAILRDRIGVVPAIAVDEPALNTFIADSQLKVSDSRPGGIMTLSVDSTRELGDLEKLVRSVKSRNAARGDKPLIAQAGLLVKTEGSDALMLLTEEFIAEFKDNVPAEAIEQLNAKNRVEVVKRNPFRKNQYLLRSTAESNMSFLEAPARYYESELAKISHPNFYRPKVLRQQIPDDPQFGQQWHHHNTGQSGGTPDADIDTPLAWAITRGSDNVFIAVIDNGFDAAHPDLAPNLWSNPGEIPADGIDNDNNTLIDDVNGWDFVDDDNIVTGGAHGTNVAGCVGARGNNATGVTGSCQQCRLMFIRTPMSPGSEFVDGLSFDYARAMGAQIITNSWGYEVGATSTPTVIQAINDAATQGRGNLGAVVLFAMNNPHVNDCDAHPDISSLENVIAVSRATNRDRFDNSGFGNCMDVLGPTRSENGFGTLGITTTAPGGGYTNNFGGTSAATPITAGIAGLMLDVSPTLTRLEVQRALQDTTDRIEDSLGAYSAVSGYSSPASGIATHGYGRVNAFEAVRLVAPADRNGRNGVDVMLRDNRLDWGNTEQHSNVLFEPTRGFIPHWESVDIKVDAPPFQSPPTNASEFDAFTDEAPQAMQTNRVHVRVRNRGPRRADSVTVKLHWVFAGTALPALPTDFWTAFPQDSSDVSTWHPLGVRTINNLEYSGASVAGNTTLDLAQIVSFDFAAPALDPTQPSYQHYCLFCVLDSPQDPISAEARSSLVPDFISPRNNNVTHRNLVVQPPATEGQSLVRFLARNPSGEPLKTKLAITAPAGYSTKLEPAEVTNEFDLKAGEERPVELLITRRASEVAGELVVMQYDLRGASPTIIGGMTVRMDGMAVDDHKPVANAQPKTP